MSDKPDRREEKSGKKPEVDHDRGGFNPIPEPKVRTPVGPTPTIKRDDTSGTRPDKVDAAASAKAKQKTDDE